MNKLKEFGTVQQLIILRGGEHVGFIYIEYETVENVCFMMYCLLSRLKMQ